MNVKDKIALQSLARSLQRGVITEEKAKQRFEEITGRPADQQPEEGDIEGQELGKFLDALAERFPMPAASELPDPQDQPEPLLSEHNTQPEPASDKRKRAQPKAKAKS